MNVMEAVGAVPGLDERLASGIHVLVFGRDGGDSTLTLAAAFPRSRFLGIEPDPAGVERARRLTTERRLRSVYWLALPAHQLAPLPTYDLICTFAGLHEMVEPRAALRAIHAALAADGVSLWSEANAADDDGGLPPLAKEAGFSQVDTLAIDAARSRCFALRK